MLKKDFVGSMFLVFSSPSQQVTGWGIIYLMILFFGPECQSVELSVPLKCRSKCLIQRWTWNLDCWGSAPKKAQKHLMGEFEPTTSQVRSRNPAWLLRARSRHLGSGRHLGGCSALQLQRSWPSAAHPWVMKHDSGVCDQGLLLRSEFRSSCQRQFFVKWRSGPEGRCYFFSLQDGAHKEVEACPCHPGQCPKDQQDLRFSSVLSLF